VGDAFVYTQIACLGKGHTRSRVCVPPCPAGTKEPFQVVVPLKTSTFHSVSRQPPVAVRTGHKFGFKLTLGKDCIIKVCLLGALAGNLRILRSHRLQSRSIAHPSE
jgi:hypothetical protein